MVVARDRVGRDYYHDYPSGDLKTGDIYSRLPMDGLIEEPAAAGIVITPSCDLAQSKSPTATYLPILPVTRYLAMPDIRRRVLASNQKHLPSAALADIFGSATEQLELVDRATRSALDDGSATKLKALSRYLRGCVQSDPDQIRNGFRESMGKKNAQKEVRDMVQNKPIDTYFLPPPSGGIRAFADPSVVLFRYPVTVPYELLEDANAGVHATNSTWPSRVADRYPTFAARFPDPPLRCQRLRADFLADLATQFTALYTRIGSPDFTPTAVESQLDLIWGGGGS